MSGAVADNDILYKGAWYGLLHELLGVIPCAPQHTLVLGQARFVVGKRIERQHKNGVPGAAAARARFVELLATLSQVEPSAAEQSFAADLENVAQQLGLPLDAGESLLCAVAIQRGLAHVVTGDKRAIAALETLSDERAELVAVAGRLLCLEQLFVRLLSVVDSKAIKTAVCQSAHVDQALANCFSCSSPEVPPERSIEGLASYIDALRAVAPRLLAT
jgi:hypothetical protein